ncbi:MAG: DNA polymerase III subunit alpha [Geminicoccaceae bacterium]
MTVSDFVHLRVRSCWSLLRSTVDVKSLVAACQAERMPAVAVTDRAALFGAFDFGSVTVAAGVQPIVGCLMPLRLEDDERGPPRRSLLPLLVQNQTGYRCLLKLLSAAYLDPGRDEIEVDWSDLEHHHEGLIALTGGLEGPIGAALLRRDEGEAGRTLERLAKLFDDRLYVELSRLGHPEEARTEEGFLALADRTGLPLVATNDVHFIQKVDAEAQDVLLCVAEGSRQADEDRARGRADHRFKSAAEMADLFADVPEAIANTSTIARRCAYRIEPHDPILPAFPSKDGRSEEDELRAQAAEGLEARLHQAVFTATMGAGEREAAAEKYRDRLAYELDVIVQMRFPGYFLIVSDFIKWAKLQGIPVGPGRGSGAGSVVAWSLDITDLDPLKFGLLFERFLNPERVSMPDFDIDFCQNRRDEVIAYVAKRYGRDRVAHIITFGKLQARAVLRDVGRVLGMPYGQVDRISKLVPFNPANPPSLEQALEMEPRLKEERDADEQVAHLIDLARKLEGLPRHASTHAAGVVIGDRPLDALIPLYRDPRSEMPVTQFNMKDVEKVGLVKFDFLGLTTLTLLQLAVQILKDQLDVELDLMGLPLDDPATYALMSRAETNGVFQLESGGMKTALRELRPDCFEDIIAMVSLYRPGPMDNIPRYIAVKHGREEPAYQHPMLEPILKETNGVIIYQEQVMQIARDLAGYSLGAADLLRRAMGKKIKAEMDAQRDIFVSGAVERGIESTKASEIFDSVAKFASYGFNKSHAAAYALLAYQTGYVKANHPLAFFAASMTMDKANHARLANAREELLKSGITLLGPDINRSEVDFSVQEHEGERIIRFALSAIRGVGEQAMRLLVAERQANGAFEDLFDLVARVGGKVLNRRLLEGLIRAGALDGFGAGRTTQLHGIDAAFRYAQAKLDSVAGGQIGLFSEGGEDVAIPKPALAAVDEPPMMQTLEQEYEALGFFLSAHPLDGYRDALERLQVTSIRDIAAAVAPSGSRSLRLAGIVLSKQERTTPKTRFAFVVVSDAGGQCELAVFAELLSRVRDLLEGNQPLLIEVDARMDGDSVRLTATDIEPLDVALGDGAGTVEIHLKTAAVVEQLAPVLGESGASVRLVLPVEGAEERVAVQLPNTHLLASAQRADVARLAGVDRIRDLP